MRVRVTTLILAFALWTAPAFAQGCAMCYSAAAANTPASQRAMNRAVLMLLIPPVGMMSLLVGAGFVYARRRDRRVEAEDTTEVEQTH
jgi:hypothetical protein